MARIYKKSLLTCSECGGIFYAKGLCKLHYNRAYAKRYMEENGEAHALACKRWKAANRGKLKEYRDKSRSLDPEKWKRWEREFRRKNPGIKAIYQQNRAARQRANGGELSTDIRERLSLLQNRKCACCKQLLVKSHLDHIMPIALGGRNEDSNVQLLCPTCNRKKHAKHPVDFMQERGFLL